MQKSYLIFSRRTLAVLALLLFIFVSFGWGIFWTELTLFAAQQRQLQLAGSDAQKALWFVAPLNVITFKAIPDVVVWQSGLREFVLVAQVQKTAPLVLQQMLMQSVNEKTNPTPSLQKTFQQLNQNTQQLEAALPHSFFGSQIIQPKIKVALQKFFPDFSLANFSLANGQTPTISQITQDLEQAVTTLNSGSQKILILFQNSQELRATGGFMGSYALWQLQDGQLQNLEVQDIYVPDGQFKGFMEAPSGLKEYLSNDHGVRLPDANWWPDFPTSAQNILTFFANSKQSQIDKVVVVNLSVAEDILRVTGDIYLPDYQLNVNADNLASVARSDREQFFPGSQQKRNFLAALFNQLKIKWPDLTVNQQMALLQLLGQKLQTKDIQLFANNPDLEKVWQRYGFDGGVWQSTQPDIFSFFAVESNVGINKANKKISRQVEINKNKSQVIIKLSLNNLNDPLDLEPPVPPLTKGRPLDYIDYQRFLLPNTVQVDSITVDGKELNSWQTNSVNSAIAQVGFLVTVPVGEVKVVQLNLTLSDKMAEQKQLVLQKQSGISQIPIAINWDGQIKQLHLDRDQVISF